MGEAYAAIAQDPTAVYWNPAGISTVPGREFHSTHNEWISDVRYEYLAAVQGMNGHAVGAHVGLLHMGQLEERNEVGVLTGHFRAYDFTGGLTYGRRITRTIEMGATVKLLYSKIHDFSAISFASVSLPSSASNPACMKRSSGLPGRASSPRATSSPARSRSPFERASWTSNR